MTNSQKITLNIVANLISFAISIIISLFITPIIVNALGGEAYGFVGLAQNFVSYATLVTVALNSMASRFISIEIYKEDYRQANKYFSSVFISNSLIALVMLPVFVGIVWYLEYMIDIPAALVEDVKCAFAITFIQFLLNVMTSQFEVATFVTNRLYLSQKNGVISSFLRLALTLLMFKLFSVKITYLVMATFVGVLFTCVMNVIYTRRYLPNISIRVSDFNFSYVRKLIASGIWNLIGKLNSMLLDGLDLLISNTFIGPVEMGAMALSKTVPAMFYSLRGTLDYPFAPPMTKCYAEGDIDGVVRNVRMGNKVLGVLIIGPIAAFSVYGRSFFTLWVPGEDATMIQILALLSMLGLVASSCINSVCTVLSVLNKIRLPALISLGSGIATVIINFILLNTTDLGVYAIAGTSSLLVMLRHYLFTPLYGAHCLKVKKSTFYHEILTGNLCLVLNLAVGFLFYRFISTGSTWISLILSAGSMAVVCIVINFFVVLSKDERAAIFTAVKGKLKRG